MLFGFCFYSPIWHCDQRVFFVIFPLLQPTGFLYVLIYNLFFPRALEKKVCFLLCECNQCQSGCISYITKGSTLLSYLILLMSLFIFGSLDLSNCFISVIIMLLVTQIFLNIIFSLWNVCCNIIKCTSLFSLVVLWLNIYFGFRVATSTFLLFLFLQ